MKTVEDFKSDCLAGKCNRGTIKSKRCSLETKQDQCYSKLKKKMEKQKDKMGQKDPLWEECRQKVWFRDAGFFIPNVKDIKNWREICRLWKCLTKEEQDYIESKYSADLWLNKDVDPAHQYGKGSNPELKYNEDHIFLVGRYFHSLLDTNRDPVTRESMTGEDRNNWFERIAK